MATVDKDKLAEAIAGAEAVRARREERERRQQEVKAAQKPPLTGAGKAVVFGTLLALAGVALMVVAAVAVDPTVLTGEHYQRVFNLQSGQQQLMLFLGGGVAALAGVVIAAAGAVCRQMARSE